MRKVLKKIGACSRYIAAFTLAALLLLTVLDVFLSNAFLIFIPGVFGLTKVLLPIIVFFAAAHTVCQRLLDFHRKGQGGAGS